VRELAKLKAEYATLVYAASKTETLDAWLFVFAAESVNQFFARLNHLRFYSQERRAQAAKIEKAREQLIGEQKVLKVKVEEKTKLLASYTRQKRELNGLQESKSSLVKRLEGKEERLQQELQARVESDRRLEGLIADMIKREMRRAEEARRRAERAEARKAGKPTPKAEPEPTDENLEAIPASPETIRLSNIFAENRGHLGWPVEQGFISGRFGKQPHPVLKGIIVENLGINIQTKSGEQVVAVASGEVGFVATIPGVEGKIISLIHGKYVTVYSNINNVAVKPGDKVKARERLGSVATDREGVSEVQFQLWKGNDRMNPESWLIGR
jgi:septal ring factor EnvC (AmiA/AmiB activator)